MWIRKCNKKPQLAALLKSISLVIMSLRDLIGSIVCLYGRFLDKYITFDVLAGSGAILV